MKYDNIVDLVATEFDNGGLVHVLIGGFALNCYKVTRLTADIDLMIAEKDCDRATACLQKNHFKIGMKEKNFVRCHSTDDMLMDVDLLFVNNETIDRVIRDGRQTTVNNRSFKVPSLEHLIGMKLHAIKYNPALREFKDLPDIINLIRKNNIDIAADRYRDLCLRYGTEALYEKIRSVFET